MLVNFIDHGESFVHEDILSKVLPETFLVLNTVKRSSVRFSQKLKTRAKFLDSQNQRIKLTSSSDILPNYRSIFYSLIDYEWGPLSLPTPPPRYLL